MFNPKLLLGPRTPDEESLEIGAYGVMGWERNRTGYRLRKVSRQDMLNTIEVVGHLDQLLGSFDINAVQVGVDLSTGLLHWTPAYERFLRTRELELDTGFTPMQSLLRLFKKAQELPDVYLNVPRWLDFCRGALTLNQGDAFVREVRLRAMARGETATRLGREGVPARWQNHTIFTGRGEANLPLVFGHKYYGLYEQFRHVLEPHIELCKHPDQDLWLALSREVVDNGPSQRALSLHLFATTAPRVHCQRYFPASPLQTARRQRFDAFLAAIPESLRSRYEVAFGKMGDAYLGGFDSSREFQWLSRRVNDHPEIALASPYPLRLQLDTFKMLVKRCRQEHLPEPWGLVVNACHQGYFGLLLQNAELLQRALTHLRGSNKVLVQPLPLPREVFGIKVVELRTAAELQIEGARMGHCVGGYASQLSSEYSRIVSLRPSEDPDTWATLEWRIHQVQEQRRAGQLPALQLVLQQIHARFNKPASPALVQLEVQLRERLNEFLCHQVERGWELLRPKQLARLRNEGSARNEELAILDSLRIDCVDVMRFDN
jgi:hypothetical protein